MDVYFSGCEVICVREVSTSNFLNWFFALFWSTLPIIHVLTSLFSWFSSPAAPEFQDQEPAPALLLWEWSFLEGNRIRKCAIQNFKIITKEAAWKSWSPDWCIAGSSDVRQLNRLNGPLHRMDRGRWYCKQTSRSMLTCNNLTAPRFVFHTLTASGEEKLPSTLTVLIKSYLSTGAISVRMLGSGGIRLWVKIHWYVVHIHHGTILSASYRLHVVILHTRQDAIPSDRQLTVSFLMILFNWLLLSFISTVVNSNYL